MNLLIRSERATLIKLWAMVGTCNTNNIYIDVDIVPPPR